VFIQAKWGACFSRLVGYCGDNCVDCDCSKSFENENTRLLVAWGTRG
jgi:hypothetical protein